MKRTTLLAAALLSLTSSLCAQADSYYTQRLADPNAVYVTAPGSGDATALLQEAINRVQETHRQGIIFLAEGRYQATNTLYIWPGIRLIGYGAHRPVLVLPPHTPGFEDASREQLMIFFAGGRPGFGRNGRPEAMAPDAPVPDANPGTFYSAVGNVDIEIGDGNPGAVGVRSHYAQHCYLAHMDFRIGSGLAAVHEAGNVAEDLHISGGRYGIWTGKPSPGWQFTMVDCSFEGQREAAIYEHEAGLTLIRPLFRSVPSAVKLEPDGIDELWLKDARLEDISGPTIQFGVETNPRNEINVEGAVCRNVPLFVEMRDSGRRETAPADLYEVKTFSHGLRFADIGAVPHIENIFRASPLPEFPARAPSDLRELPPRDTWANVRDLGAVGDGTTDDTAALQRAIAEHPTIYLPTGFYVVRDTLKLRPDSVLIGLHPGATQIMLPDGTETYAGAGTPKALLEAPPGGSNIVTGIGLYTSGNNPRAVAALWHAGANSMMNDVRFLGGHGTPKPDGSRENPYNADHSGDPNPERHWNSQYPSLWVQGGGGTFFDIWTPSTFARAGMLVSETEIPGRVYELSSEHHVRNEVKLHNAAHWRIYALQTEEERGESGQALPLEIENCEDVTVANFHGYRVISMFQPFPWAIKVSNSHNIRFRNVHVFSNSKVSFDCALYDQTHDISVRQREFARLDISGRTPPEPLPRRSRVLADGARVEKLAGGFHNISGGVAAPNGDFYFVDAHPNKIYRWDATSRTVTQLTNTPPEPVNLALDGSGNLLVVSYQGKGSVFAWKPGNKFNGIQEQIQATNRGATYYLPVSDWSLNRHSLEQPAAWFASPEGSVLLPAGADFLAGAVSWGVKSSPPIRAFGLAPAHAGGTFFITDESSLTTWAADVRSDGGLENFRLFTEDGGEAVAADAHGNVFLAVGQIDVYSPKGRWIETIEIPERPTQVVFGGSDHQTLFIPARTSLYRVRVR